MADTMRRLHQTFVSTIETIFVIMGRQNLALRKCAVTMDKWLKLEVHAAQVCWACSGIPSIGKRNKNQDKTMATLHVRTGQDQNAILLHSANNQDTDQSNMSCTDSTNVPFKNGREFISSSHTLSTCSSWTYESPSSLALQPTFSADYSIEDAASLANEKLGINDSTTNNCQHGVALDSGVAALPLFLETPSDLTTKQKEWNEEAANNNEQKVNFVGARDRCCDSGLASERRHWIEQTLLNNDHKPYSTNARKEISKCQGNSTELASERKHWIESTLLFPVRSSYSQKNDVKQGLQELQQVPSSVAEHQKWLTGMTQVISELNI